MDSGKCDGRVSLFPVIAWIEQLINNNWVQHASAFSLCQADLYKHGEAECGMFYHPLWHTAAK